MTRLPLIITEFMATAPARSAAVDQQWHAGLERRRVEGVADADDERARHQRPQRRVEADEHGQHGAEDALDRLHHDEVRAPRVAIGEDAGRDRQQQQRAELGEHEHADERRRPGALLDVRRQREVLHPRADVGGEQADPDPAEVPVRERGAGGAGTVVVGEGVGRRGHRRSTLGSRSPRTVLAPLTWAAIERRYRHLMSSGTATPKLSMAELTRVAAERYGDAKAAEFLRDGEWASLTFDELWSRAQAIANGLIGLGLEPGDRVGILANTRVEFTLVDLAASSAGAVVVPVYPTNSADECRWVLGDSRASIVVCESVDHVGRIAEVRADLPSLRHTIVIDGAGTGRRHARRRRGRRRRRRR